MRFLLNPCSARTVHLRFKIQQNASEIDKIILLLCKIIDLVIYYVYCLYIKIVFIQLMMEIE